MDCFIKRIDSARCPAKSVAGFSAETATLESQQTPLNTTNAGMTCVRMSLASQGRRGPQNSSRVKSGKREDRLEKKSCSLFLNFLRKHMRVTKTDFRHGNRHSRTKGFR